MKLIWHSSTEYLVPSIQYSGLFAYDKACSRMTKREDNPAGPIAHSPRTTDPNSALRRPSQAQPLRLHREQLGVLEGPEIDRLVEGVDIDFTQQLIMGAVEDFLVTNGTLHGDVQHVILAQRGDEHF